LKTSRPDTTLATEHHGASARKQAADFIEVTVLDDESTPVLYNDSGLSARVKASLMESLGSGSVFDTGPLTGSENVGVVGLEGHQISVACYWLGALYPDRFAAATAAALSLLR